MLQLKGITKNYHVAGGDVQALKGINIEFPDTAFVSILGASGCGKTTLLNIIGGLDKYTSGDLVINGVSTKQYNDRDWDTYRNHSIGFIFQSYHLIPHQTILQNVELALTIAGIDKEERRRRAIEALEKVGLSDKINNRPNQLSGGQAQRVAIARALINNPEIVLADEPTGALDSKTSVQIMELLKEISQERLVIMVTHNPELAEKYSTRIIRLLDGEVIDDKQLDKNSERAENDAKPQNATENDASLQNSAKVDKGRKKRSSMSIATAFMLSLKNLLSKAKRTAIVAFAGSIGIIGVSMVLAISAGVQGYIKSMEDDMLSGYPLTVKESTINFETLMNLGKSTHTKVELNRLKDKVYVDSMLETLMSLNSATVTNVITDEYKKYIDAMPSKYYNALQYGYDFHMSNYIYTDYVHKDERGENVTENLSISGIRGVYTSVLGKQPNYKQYSSIISTISSFKELPDNYNYILSQYDILATFKGEKIELSDDELKDIFTNKNSLIMVIDKNSFSDLNFGQFGYMTQDEFLNFAYKAEEADYDEEVIKKYDGTPFSFFVGENAHSFKWYPNDTIYTKPDPTEIFYLQTPMGVQPVPGSFVKYKYNPSSKDFNQNDGVDMSVKVILQKKSHISYGCLSTGLYYTKALTEHTLKTAENSNVVKAINESESKSLDYMVYNYSYTYPDPENGGKLKTENTSSYLLNTSTDSGAMLTMSMTGGNKDVVKVTLDSVAGAYMPKWFKIFPLNFESKDYVTDYLDEWNAMCERGDTYEGVKLDASNKVEYNDTVGLIIMLVNTMIEMVTIALVAFTALSLVVSTVMVGIITYVSVVERIKEIGILRSVGARKKDIKRLFIAETFIIGLSAGIVGVGVTYILSFIINMIVGALSGVYTIAALPILSALIMVSVSVVLTLISGLIPASAAAKKDPVVALRTE